MMRVLEILSYSHAASFVIMALTTTVNAISAFLHQRALSRLRAMMGTLEAADAEAQRVTAENWAFVLGLAYDYSRAIERRTEIKGNGEQADPKKMETMGPRAGEGEGYSDAGGDLYHA